MQTLIREKKYKARDPMETVGIIKGILKSRGIETEETFISEKEVGVYSCRIFLKNNGLGKLDIGTNGKGMTKEYALASGYAEFMERLQNGRLFKMDSCLQPGITTVPTAECAVDIRRFLKDNYGAKEKASEQLLSSFDSFRMADFTSYDGRHTLHVPMDLLLTISMSNGMCAGNTRTEAVIQGTSEVFERYAVSKITFEHLCPPVIPDEYFIGHEVLDKLRCLKEMGIYYEIRDCSLGIGLPVIGLYLRRPDGREYFHLGSDPSPVTSLERTVTEVFQGVETLNDVSFYEPVNEDHDITYWKYQIEQRSHADGTYPKELRGNTYSWEFKGFDHPVSSSDEEDINYCLDIIHSLGKELYLRDVSFLGFPSYYCYIPGLNTLRFTTDSGEELRDYLVKKEEIQKHLKAIDPGKTELKELAELLADYSKEFRYMYQNSIADQFFPKGEFSWRFCFPYYLRGVLFASCGLDNMAAEDMKRYIFSSKPGPEMKKKLTDIVMYLKSGEYEIDDTLEIRKWIYSESLGCEDCGRCCVESFCQRTALDDFARKIFT